MKVRIRPNSQIHEEDCWICGNRFTTPVAVAYACDENEHEFGSVCPECLEEGAAAIKERFEIRAHEVMREAMRLEGVAEAMRSEAITVPTIEAYKSVCRRCTYEPHGDAERLRGRRASRFASSR